MVKTLVVSFAILVTAASGFAAENTAPTGDFSGNGTNNVARNVRGEASSRLASAADSSNDEDSAAETELLNAANKSRELAGVPPLQLEESLQAAARAHARQMVRNDRLEHQLPGELPLLERIAQVISLDSPVKIDRAGENIANASCAPSANDVLMRSAPHRQNLLDSGFNIAGIAAVWRNGRLYVVQDFAHEVRSYSAQQSRKLVAQAIHETRHQAALPELTELTPPKLDEAACSLARENRPNAHLLAAAYENRKIIAYTQSRPEILPAAALPLLRDPGVRQFAVGSCYARNAAYPTGMYWVAILLY
jgi:uncharacterized protein YkwD